MTTDTAVFFVILNILSFCSSAALCIFKMNDKKTEENNKATDHQ